MESHCTLSYCIVWPLCLLLIYSWLWSIPSEWRQWSLMQKKSLEDMRNSYLACTHTWCTHSVEWQCANGLCRAVTMRKENLRGRGPWQRRQKRPRSTGEGGPFLFYWLNGLKHASRGDQEGYCYKTGTLVGLRYSLVSLTGHLYVVRV